MHIGIFSDRRARLAPGWIKETLVGIFSDSEIDASVRPGPDPSIKVVGLFSEVTVRVPAGFSISDSGFVLFGEQDFDVPGGDAGEIRIEAYGLCCDLKIIESADPPTT